MAGVGGPSFVLMEAYCHMLQTQGLPSRSSPLSGASHLPEFQWETPGCVYSAGQCEHLGRLHIRDLAAHPTPSGSLPGHAELSGCKYTAKPSSWPAVGSLTPVSIQRHASLSLLCGSGCSPGGTAASASAAKFPTAVIPGIQTRNWNSGDSWGISES